MSIPTMILEREGVLGRASVPSDFTTSEQAEVLHTLEECLQLLHLQLPVWISADFLLETYLQDQYVAFRVALGDVPSPVLLDYMPGGVDG